MSQEIQEQLHKQQEVIADKQLRVKEDLDKVEPAVIEAQNGVCTLSEVWLSGEGGQMRGQHGLPPEVPVMYVSTASLISLKSLKPFLNT